MQLDSIFRIAREAFNSTNITANKEHQMILISKTAMDDSGVATDDTGIAGRYCYAELLRRQKIPLIIQFTVTIKPSSARDIKVTAVGFKGKDSSIFAYLLEEKNKRVLYAPCDTIHFEQKIFNLDLLITECGLFSYEKIKSEISFPAMMKRIKLLKPKRAILTHIEEDEINTWGWNYLNKMKEQYADVDFDFAYDDMEIEV